MDGFQIELPTNLGKNVPPPTPFQRKGLFSMEYRCCNHYTQPNHKHQGKDGKWFPIDEDVPTIKYTAFLTPQSNRLVSKPWKGRLQVNIPPVTPFPPAVATLRRIILRENVVPSQQTFVCSSHTMQQLCLLPYWANRIGVPGIEMPKKRMIFEMTGSGDLITLEAYHQPDPDDASAQVTDGGRGMAIEKELTNGWNSNRKTFQRMEHNTGLSTIKWTAEIDSKAVTQGRVYIVEIKGTQRNSAGLKWLLQAVFGGFDIIMVNYVSDENKFVREEVLDVQKVLNEQGNQKLREVIQNGMICVEGFFDYLRQLAANNPDQKKFEFKLEPGKTMIEPVVQTGTRSDMQPKIETGFKLRLEPGKTMIRREP